MRGRMRRTAFPVLALMGLPAMAGAQVRAGNEFRVNSYTTGYQYARVNAVAASAAGRFVVVWESSAQDGSGYAALASRFDVNGVRQGSEFIVNTYTTSDQYFASVGINAFGRFVVAWQSYTQDGSREGVFAQRFDRVGGRNGGEFQVNTFTTHTQSRSSVALDTNGNVVIAWRSGSGPAPQDGDASGVYARRFSSGGLVQGGEFQANTYTTEYQNRPDVARAPDGTFVIVWQSYNQEGASSGYGVFAQRYASDGVPLGPELRVNTYTTGDQARPSVAMDGTGAFVVAWTDYALRDGSGTSVRAQRYNASGSPAGIEFQANSNTTGFQYQPQVGVAADGGGFVIVWNSYVTTSSGIQGRRFGPTGNPTAADFSVNSYVTGAQYTPSIGIDAVGNFLVTWNSSLQDGSLSGVYAQRYGGLVPAALAVDTNQSPGPNDNGVFEPGEEVDVRPSWLNVTGADQNVSGAFSNMTGPPGAIYTITNGTGDYGTINDGATDLCSNCYAVSVNNPATRPAQHWDASVLETLTPTAQGQVKKWALHIGRSFTDVPNTQPFFRFIETLFHHGITGGCGGTNYCPTNSTTRDQMSVFVLVAKEGPGYQPPACGAPVFNDVPASNPFCRFIEELARRGVVSGCGGGNYCPTNAVTREQMAVFVLRTLDPLLNPPDCAPPNTFLDVPETSPFCKWIEELARRGVVGGCGGGNYCPTGTVTRDQMGVFISGTFGLTLYGP
jgi:S-layer family protein